jgi:uncharacterized protein YcbK (DUF882 family)
MIRRRAFFAGLASLSPVAAPFAAVTKDTNARRLSLVHGETGERFAAPYRNENGIDIGALAELAHFMRDWHVERMIAVDPVLIDFLADVMAGLRVEEATMLSGYRAPETNARFARTKFAAAEGSLHLQGRAVDVFFARRLADAPTIARRLKRGGVGWYPDSKFLHLDTGPIRNWTLIGANWRGLLAPGATKRPLTVKERQQRLRDIAKAQKLERDRAARKKS